MNLFINIVNCFVSFFFFSTDDCYNTVICMIIKRNKVFIFAYKFLNKEKLIKTYVFNNRNPVNTSSKFYLTDDQYSIIIFFYWFVVCMFIMVMVFGNFSEFIYQVFEFLYIFSPHISPTNMSFMFRNTDSPIRSLSIGVRGARWQYCYTQSIMEIKYIKNFNEQLPFVELIILKSEYLKRCFFGTFF